MERFKIFKLCTLILQIETCSFYIVEFSEKGGNMLEIKKKIEIPHFYSLYLGQTFDYQLHFHATCLNINHLLKRFFSFTI